MLKEIIPLIRVYQAYRGMPSNPLIKKNQNMINSLGRNREDKINYIWVSISQNVNQIEHQRKIHQVIQ